mmetsp:Transcript_11600/g.15292  ORF Transcript_11600/g.15292 Transcript_11600/m.15292 type:complete len:154 (-) Transcript_11600:190-651(-)|eukprot:CAMPEP_0198136874 /NCGR_PEP_ID=MMETSP1443-20131203/439_1 /TAXON_ID=186043 /ORGANISM="Entomoneis sp., Strain CCMP2396" /LENGTH=153 /DNA_ID=CAMNT_0043798161 /DNA_START=123 /DNA_END=584 /DNA_ORIENTATION=+
MKFLPLLFCILSVFTKINAFVTPTAVLSSTKLLTLQATVEEASGSDSGAETGDPKEYIARRIIVEGDVQGGYYRSCVLNEGGRFRRLVGTMSPPDDTKRAEIYVEGKRNVVEGFVRWCKKSSKNVGLSQLITVAEVMKEEPTGLYDDFYVKTK